MKAWKILNSYSLLFVTVILTISDDLIARTLANVSFRQMSTGSYETFHIFFIELMFSLTKLMSLPYEYTKS
jgi:hypothetical protein